MSNTAPSSSAPDRTPAGVLAPDYAERVYAGVLGKMIGVYLGRPFEGWSYERIGAELGEIFYYVHDRLGQPLVVTDDDLSGTFTFLRALPDYAHDPHLTPAQIAETWLNYLIENRTVLWWGGMGNSTEHTAFLRLKQGIPAPRSGSIETNGRVVAEQIGAQIFIDGWGMIHPGDPERAAEFARRAASVSHDGEAIHGAQVVAALEAQAFVERDLDRLLDTAVRLIPRDSRIYRLIADLREWHAEGTDWRGTRERIAARYGYDRYGGGCHVIPNHALVIHALLHGAGDFQESLMIVNNCGWDTDCNSGNVGCVLGIRGGLAGLEAGPDWRGPVADRLYLPTADGGRCITDALSESYRVVNIGRALAGREPVAPKQGARFHFSLPGSVQGFMAERGPGLTPHAAVEHAGERGLALRYRHMARGCAARMATATFIPPEALHLTGYRLYASPTLYPGQTVRAAVAADPANGAPVRCRHYLRHYDAGDLTAILRGPEVTLAPGAEQRFEWRVPDVEGYPIAAIGIEAASDARADGALYLDSLTWEGAPETVLRRPAGGTVWKRAWVDGVDHFGEGPEPCRVVQDAGTGLLIQGTREWRDYRVTAAVSPHMARSSGVAARVHGMRRYYALLLCGGGRARLVKALEGTTVLAETEFDWAPDGWYDLGLEVRGRRIRARIGETLLFEVEDADRPLEGGAIALVCEEGRLSFGTVRVEPATGRPGGAAAG